MQRVNEKRKATSKENVKNIKKDIKIQDLIIKTDILYILRNYEKRIHFYNQSDLLRNCKKYSKTSLVYTEKIPFDINLDFYRNLKSLTIKFTKKVDLGYFSNKKLEKIELNAVDKIFISKPILAENLRILNCDIEIETLTKILETKNLKSLSLINVYIYSKHDVYNPKDIVNIMNSNSEENCEINCEDLEIEDVTNLYHEDVVNSKICKLFQILALKKLTLIETNIKLETVKSSGIMAMLNIFKFKTFNTAVFYSFSREIFSYLKTNQDFVFNMEDIEKLVIPNTKLLFKCIDFTHIKVLEISNSQISNELVELLGRKFVKCVSFAFLNCSFTDVSFTRFLNMFGAKISYLNLIDSDLPFDALAQLRTKLNDCKVIFRDKRIFNCHK